MENCSFGGFLTTGIVAHDVINPMTSRTERIFLTSISLIAKTVPTKERGTSI